MAKIKLRIQSLESVDESVRDYYTEDTKDGGFILQAEPDSTGLGIGPLASLRGKLEEASKKEAKVKGMLLTKEDDSLWTREEVEAMEAEVASLKEANAALSSKTKGGEEVLKQQVAAAKGPLQKENADLKARVDQYRKTVYEAEADRLVSQVLKEMKPKEEWDGLMRRELASHVLVEEVDGKVVSKFVDPSTGQARFSSSSDNDGPMDYKEFANIPELRTQYEQCLQGDGKTGANLKDNEPPRGRKPEAGPSKKDVTISQADAKNFALWVEASEAAAKQGGTVVIVEDN